MYEEKIALFKKMGVAVLVKIPFTLEFSLKGPEDFVKEILCDSLDTREVFVGYNYRFGKGREGNISKLRVLGIKLGFKVVEVNQISIDGEIVSSTKIRNLLRDGAVEHAAKLLGRHYAITGIVIRGDGRGKAIGVPTANIAPIHEIIPASGVYAVKLFIRNRYYSGIANVGYRPTFDRNTLTMEVNIFNFDEDIYGEEITLSFIRKIRDEMKFIDINSLIQQINLDIETARKI
ncbi:MAG TPA: riboflavin biosynthesis protein RibF [Nitrospiraceae bacterium]|nr:riboflavin biosynthesis protein RibF [Nitrospiraceae bacterium]